VAGIEVQRPLFAESPDEDDVALPTPSVAEDLQADYASTGLTLGVHPMSLLRDRLRKERCLDSEEVTRKRSGARVRVAVKRPRFFESPKIEVDGDGARSEGDRRQAGQRSMRAVVVVTVAPVFGHAPDLGQAGEKNRDTQNQDFSCICISTSLTPSGSAIRNTEA
jgi:hypothetical protein